MASNPLTVLALPHEGAPTPGAAIAPEVAATMAKFRTLFAAIRRHNRETLERCGVGAMQLRALAIVRDKPDLGVSELARMLLIRQPSASKLVEELVHREMLSRKPHPRDGRATALRLRKTGALALERAPGPHLGLLPDALGKMDPARLQRLDEAMADLLGDLRVDPAEGSLEPLSDT